jgi:uroporphyrinogen-III synthase
MRLLVTRPEPDALRLRAVLEQMGHEVTVEPLLRVEFVYTGAIDLDGVQALIATSRNGVRAIRSTSLLARARGLPLFAVGQATAQEARSLGFGMVVTGAGTAHELVTHIVSVVDPAAGLLLHLAGDKLAVDLRAELEPHGFRVLQAVVYRTLAAKAFSEDVIEQLAEGEIEGAIFMSSRTAVVYAQLVARHGLSSVVRRITHFCLSETIAERLQALKGVHVEVAASPRPEELLALIDEAAAQSHV